MFIIGKFTETDNRLVVSRGLEKGWKERLLMGTVFILRVVEMFQNNSDGCTHLWVQLALKQHGFELHGSISTWVFFNGIELYDPRLVESTEAELQTQRADYEVLHVFSVAAGWLP